MSVRIAALQNLKVWEINKYQHSSGRAPCILPRYTLAIIYQDDLYHLKIWRFFLLEWCIKSLCTNLEPTFCFSENVKMSVKPNVFNLKTGSKQTYLQLGNLKDENADATLYSAL